MSDNRFRRNRESADGSPGCGTLFESAVPFRRSGIRVFSVFDPIKINPLKCVVDPIKNAILPDSNAISVLVSQIKTAWRARVFRQGADLFQDSS